MNSVHSIVSPINCCWYSVWPTTGPICVLLTVYSTSSRLDFHLCLVKLPLLFFSCPMTYFINTLRIHYDTYSITIALAGGQVLSWSAVMVLWLSDVHYKCPDWWTGMELVCGRCVLIGSCPLHYITKAMCSNHSGPSLVSSVARL